MSGMRKDYGGYIGALLVLFVLFGSIWAGYQMLTKWVHQANQMQSWDQANLKKDDHGCPTAIYVAPKGELVQCQAGFRVTIESAKPAAEFRTIEEAALDGLKTIAEKPLSYYYEWGGEIIKTQNGTYSATTPNTSLFADHVQIRDVESDDIEVVATYHSHPCMPGYYTEYFSYPDLIEPVFFHKTAFMGDLCSGKAHEFKYGDLPGAEHPRGHDEQRIYLTQGRIIGRFAQPRSEMVIE